MAKFYDLEHNNLLQFLQNCLIMLIWELPLFLFGEFVANQKINTNIKIKIKGPISSQEHTGGFGPYAQEFSDSFSNYQPPKGNI